MITWLLLAATIVGHLAIWCTVFNQVHATRIQQHSRSVVEKIMYVIIGGLLLWIIVQGSGIGLAWMMIPFRIYQAICLVAAMAIFIRWIWIRLVDREPDALQFERKSRVRFDDSMDRPGYQGLQAKLLSLIPGNQSLQLSVEHRTICISVWPKGLNGLTVAHLSDLHFTGKIDKRYFELVCEECNQHQPDVIFLTGDVVDEPGCIPWLFDTLGSLHAPFGKFYILGNHDQRCLETELRASIEATGFQRLSGEWLCYLINDHPIWLAGNETPWFPNGLELQPDIAPKDQPKILLSHTPDHFRWGQQIGFDLILAGHTHGGQIRFPVIGPIIAPSRYGVRYAGGTFQSGKTVMHVSRGISGDDPIRLNCPPELAIIRINGPE